MIPNELYDMAWKLSLEDKLLFCKDLLTDISRNTNNVLDELANKKAEIKIALKFTSDEVIKNIFSEDKIDHPGIDITCSKCGHRYWTHDFHYCPICGSYMRTD